jgi:hypothetical protein
MIETLVYFYISFNHVGKSLFLSVLYPRPPRGRPAYFQAGRTLIVLPFAGPEKIKRPKQPFDFTFFIIRGKFPADLDANRVFLAKVDDKITFPAAFPGKVI